MTDTIAAETLGLILTNVVLGVVCVGLLAAIAGAVVMELFARARGGRTEAAPPPPAPAARRGRGTLADARSELPEGWPPLGDERTQRFCTTRV